MDQDKDARKNLPQSENILFANQNFRYLENYCRSYSLLPLDGILADLGVSSYQFDTPERGFSIRYQSTLDMRMNQDQELSATRVLNSYSQEELQNVFSRYGEITNAASLSRLILVSRLNKPIEEVNEFKALIAPLVRRGKENQYYAQVFQALRIEVNAELEALEKLLEQSVNLLAVGGRLVVISYHSLEDRLVKNFINKGKFIGEVEKDIYGNELKPFRSISRGAIIPSKEEMEANSRSRSAKMRVGEKMESSFSKAF
jgi:16S rRNA (cytosine1402-N4)-methyltransferase